MRKKLFESGNYGNKDATSVGGEVHKSLIYPLFEHCFCDSAASRLNIRGIALFKDMIREIETNYLSRWRVLNSAVCHTPFICKN